MLTGLCIVTALAAQPLSPAVEAQPACSNFITGTPGDDVLTGSDGDDCILGLGGDDDIFGNGGADWIAGGDGDDFIVGGTGNDRIDGGAGHNALDGEEGSDDLAGGSGDDDVDGGSGNDRISGGAGEDYLVGGEDSDRVEGGEGDDVLDDAFDEPLETSLSNDELVGGPGDDELLGGPGADELKARDGVSNEVTDGGDGTDACTADADDVVSACEPGLARSRAVAAAADAAVTAARRTPLRISAISWNVHERLSDDQQIADVLADAVGSGTGDLKLVGLQEMCFSQINDVVESTGRLEDQTGRNWSWEDSEPHGDYSRGRCANGNVVLASRDSPASSITNVVRKRFEAQDDDCPGGLVFGLRECRNYVRFDVGVGSREVRVYSVHIGGDSDLRARQIRELATDIRQERLVIPRIVLGDFNVNPRDRALRPMTRLFRDVLHRRNTPSTYTNTSGPCPGGDNRIDYIFVRRIRIQRAYVPRLSDERNVSDHCPVVAKLQIP